MDQAEQLTRADGAELIARLDRLPVWPYHPWVIALFAFGWFFAYVDIGNIGFALPIALRTFHISPTWGATAVSLGLLGFVVGELGVSFLGDLKGRRVAVIAAITLYSVGSIVNATAPNGTVFIISRFVSGAGIGAYIGSASAFMGEIIPAGIRGRYASWLTLPSQLGSGIVPLIALGLLPYVDQGWRWLLALPALALIVLVLGVRNLPESVRWLTAHGHVAKAEPIVLAAEARARARLGGADLPPVQAAARRAVADGVRQGFRIGSVFRPPILRNTIVLFLVWFFNYVGVYGFVGVGVTLLVQHGYTLSHSIQMTLAGSVGGLIGGLIAPGIADRFQRKWPPFIATCVLVAEFVLLGYTQNYVLIALQFFLLQFQIGIFAPLVYLLTAEHFPTAGRNLGVAFTNGVGHVGGAIGPVLATTVYAAFGFGPVFLTFGLSFALCAVCLLFTQRTNGRNLEAIVLDETGRRTRVRPGVMGVS